MIYCQLRNRAKITMGQPLRLGDVGSLFAPKGTEQIVLRCPAAEGVWKLEALAVARALEDA